jgi:CRP-like cAMP-binding protein
VAFTYGPHDRQPHDGFAVEFSPNDLAEMLGLSRQSLNLCMKQLEKLGLIEQKYTKGSIKDNSLSEQLVKDEL